MTFLKRLGLGIAKGAAILSGLAPLFPILNNGQQIAGIADKVQDGLAEAASIVVNVEAIGAALKLTGQQKLTAAAPLIAQLIKNRLVAGKKIHDTAKFDAGVVKATEAIVDILNSIDEDEVKTA